MNNNGERKNKIIPDIITNYQQLESSIVEQLYMKHALHGTTIGTEREEVWSQVFEAILPKKFVIERSVFIIDSQKNVSHEVDLAIFDETYTPYIFRYGRIKFIPIEAVAAIVECKSQNIKTETIKAWYDSIVKLRTATGSIARLANYIAIGPAPAQQSTRPLRILCSMSENVGKEVIESNMFDFILTAVKRDRTDSHLKITVTEAFRTLKDWYRELNFYQCSQKINTTNINGEKELETISLKDYEILGEKNRQASLLTFNFQLNQLLMLINNPILFPHREYVRMFNQKGENRKNDG